jgi:hypothetical protein
MSNDTLIMVFTGLGVVVAAIIGIWQFYTHNHKKKTENTHGESEQSPTPTAKEIKKQLTSATPYTRKSVSDSYKGILVEWLVELFDINLNSKKDDSPDRISVHSTDGSSMLISFFSSVEKYPFLKILKKGDKFRIKGKIETTETLWIELVDVCIIPKAKRE